MWKPLAKGSPCQMFQLYTVAPPRPNRFCLARVIRLRYHISVRSTMSY